MFKPGMFEGCASEHKTMNCIAECLMDDSGVLVNKKIDLEYMIYCASTNLKDNKQPFWLKPVEVATRHCVQEAWKLGDSQLENEDDGCQKLPGTVMGCMLMQLSFSVFWLFPIKLLVFSNRPVTRTKIKNSGNGVVLNPQLES
jgi:hypothetical protein